MQRFMIRFWVCYIILLSHTNAENSSRTENREGENQKIPGPVIERSSLIHTGPVFKTVLKKYVWQPTWVKTWYVKKTYIPIWKRVWRPREINTRLPKPLVLIRPKTRIIVKRLPSILHKHK